MLDAQTICEELEAFGVQLEERQAGQVAVYIDKLLLWNQRVNLTSVTSPLDIVRRHFGESMYGAQFLAERAGTLADVGSGAGFPGLVLKLVCPALKVTLIEPVTKKAVFLSEVARALNLDGVEIIRERTDNIRELQVDAVTARAVGELGGLLRWCNGVLADRGQILLWLGAGDAEMTRAVGGWNWSKPALIPGSNRRVVLAGRKGHP